MKNKVLLAISVVGFAAVAAYFVFRSRHDEPGKYRSIEAPIALSEAQRKELPRVSEAVPLYRLTSDSGMSEVLVGPSRGGEKNLRKMGSLFLRAVPPDVATPVFVCRYSGFPSATTSLDLNAKCGGEGMRVSSEPAGYVSEKVRTGFRMLFRCRSEKTGFYLSLNPNCEDARDRVHGTLGSIYEAD